jgi:hypothetical protein
MIKKEDRSHFRKVIIVAIITLVVASLGFLVYDSKEPLVKPFLTRQINPSCPYYNDFLGRVYYRYTYYPSSLFIVEPIEKKVQYYWHRVKNIDDKNIKIEKVLQETKVGPRAEMQKICIASDRNNLIYNNYVFANADVETFEILKNFFYKDKNTVYYSNGKVVPNADPQTFEVLTTDKCPESRFAKDKNNYFEATNIVEQEIYKSNCVEEL